MAQAVELDAVQLHGGEDEKFVEELQKLLPEAGIRGDFMTFLDGGFHGHGGTPSYHPFLRGFPL